MSYQIKVEIDERSKKRLIKQLETLSNVKTYDKAVARGILTVVGKNIVPDTPKDIGRLRKEWPAGFKRVRPLVYILENKAPYSLAVEEGTGIFGPKNRRITAKKGKALRFVIDGAIIFRRSVAGTKPVRMLKKNLDNLGKGISRAISRVFRVIDKGGTP